MPNQWFILCRCDRCNSTIGIPHTGDLTTRVGEKRGDDCWYCFDSSRGTIKHQGYKVIDIMSARRA